MKWRDHYQWWDANDLNQCNRMDLNQWIEGSKGSENDPKRVQKHDFMENPENPSFEPKSGARIRNLHFLWSNFRVSSFIINPNISGGSVFDKSGNDPEVSKASRMREQNETGIVKIFIDESMNKNVLSTPRCIANGSKNHHEEWKNVKFGVLAGSAKKCKKVQILQILPFSQNRNF
jgi:hypothetical protein